MNFQQKKQHGKELHGNQNYLNFIKKNHKMMHGGLNELSSPKSMKSQLNVIHNSCTFNIKKDKQQEMELPSPKKSVGGNVIHDSLSKFKMQNQQMSPFNRIYSKQSINYDDNNNTIYQYVQLKNDQIAANLLLGKTKNERHEAAKDIIFHLNKNRSHEKKVTLKGLNIQRYQSIQQPVTELNLKFPIIEKKITETLVFEPRCERNLFQNELRERIKFIQKKQKKKVDQKQQQEAIIVEQTKQDRRKQIQNKFKIREQLYGLLPVFKNSKNMNIQLKKNRHLSINKNKLKIQKAPNSPTKQLLEQYLQKNIIMKSIQPLQKQKSNVFNRQIFDNSVLQTKHEEPSFNVQYSSSIQLASRQLEVSAEIQQKNNPEIHQFETKIKNKKNVPHELKYQGDLSVYDIKIRQYRQFLFMVNLAHRIFDPISLKDPGTFKPEQRYKYYLGKGNNYLLVKSLLKRRFWWVGQDDIKKANFAWTQLKVNSFYQYQRKAIVEKKDFKLDQDVQLEEKKQKKKPKKQENKVQPAKVGFYKAPLPANDKKIFTNSDKKYYDQFLQKIDNAEKVLKFSNRLKYFEEGFFKPRQEDKSEQRCHNHLECNFFIGNKKAMFYNLKNYYDLQKKNVFEIIPLTFHIKKGLNDPNYEIFTKEFKKLAREKGEKKNSLKNVWIVKPGQLSNRGQGITVIDQIYQLNTIIKKKQKHFNGTEKTYIVQKYIQKPLLYKGRKFDIRHYMMISRLHGVMRAYWFGQGYIRTSSYQFNIDEIGDEIIHLTNDAIQKYGQCYGKYEEGNKVSYTEFQRYMDSTLGEGKFSFSEMIYPKMKNIALDAVKATYLQLDPNNTEHNFQIFGLDFMIDHNLDVWLIEVNTNPCLQLSSKLLARIIPTMVQHAFRLTLDVIYPPPSHYPNSQKYLSPDNPLERLQFELIFDENRDGKQIQKLFSNSKKIDMGQVDQQDQTYQNDGKQIQLENQID